ncbi:MAG TPA: histidine kinase dimerization/phospho-acceptor domain-containing protein [Bryobacteraceae bacterium]|nr:histidine kinase dimerization/phospho-acceptor domain-containing protein [Bryobacteraceae bacterium]
MLTAISHDLRAPLARMRLRAEFFEDSEQQRKMFSDLTAMNAMIDSALAFARDDARQEPRRLIDLGVLTEGGVCEYAINAGGKVVYAGSRGIEITCRPSTIRHRDRTGLQRHAAAVRHGIFHLRAGGAGDRRDDGKGPAVRAASQKLKWQRQRETQTCLPPQ